VTVTLTYDATNARVRISATALAAADTALVERSTDLVTWTTVRGGVAAAAAAGALVETLDDYEFADGVVNHYRVRGQSSAAISFVATTAASTGSSGSRGPMTLPVGTIAGDVVYILASTRNSGTGTPDLPAGWQLLVDGSNARLFGRVYDGVWAMPTVTFTGGAANEDTITQAATFRNAAVSPTTSAKQLNVAAQNIAYPAAGATVDGMLWLRTAWKQDDWTSVATLAGATEIGEATSTAGNDAGQVWDYLIQTTAADIAAGSFVVTGGAAAISRGMTVGFAHADYLNEQTATVTPALSAVWLKSPTRPFLNRTVIVVDPGDTTAGGRGGAGDVVGRTFPVATTDVRRATAFGLTLRTNTAGDAQTLGYILGSGDVLFLHVPAAYDWPGRHVTVGDATSHRPFPQSVARTWTLPCQQVAAPGPDVAAAIGTWESVLAGYATWDDVLAAFPTWADLLALVGDPAEVIVE